MKFDELTIELAIYTTLGCIGPLCSHLYPSQSNWFWTDYLGGSLSIWLALDGKRVRTGGHPDMVPSVPIAMSVELAAGVPAGAS